MISRFFKPASFLLIIALLSLSCSDRGSYSVKSDVDEKGIIAGLGADHVFDFPGLYFQPRNSPGMQKMAIYAPKRFFDQGQPLPVLVLLPPAFGTQYYYFERGLYELAEDMIQKGEIKPMIIVCLTNESSFGGSFFANSIPGGFYDNILGGQLLDHIKDRLDIVLPQTSKHGIGGIGMGGYGAFRAAIKSPGVYGSVSANDGPLDFDGPTGNSGLKNLFVRASNEPLNASTDTVASFSKRFRTTVNSPIVNPATIPLSMLFTGGSLAFSPNDTNATLGTILDRDVIINGVLVHTRLSVTLSSPNTIGATASKVDSIFSVTLHPTSGGGRHYFGIHLPYDSMGAINQPIWDMWMDNDLAQLHEDAVSNKPLYGVNIFMASTPEAADGYYDMTQSWKNYLRGIYGIGRVQEYSYSGRLGNPATKDQYVNDLLREMLMFHSKNFQE
ncbi:MAG: alpha/beta hydrolase-fold protein [candidate division Zixibacteria bacterium]|nr:alpha/beta hydrolase-fold protein [candidate division Zixibacteria bacterium]